MNILLEYRNDRGRGLLLKDIHDVYICDDYVSMLMPDGKQQNFETTELNMAILTDDDVLNACRCKYGTFE